jgi:phospholipid/cholesterol/gamma-HCH transport system substrate-binding protein
MEPRAHYFIVGLFVIGLTVVAVSAVLWFSADKKKPRNTYISYMNESVSGLSVQAPVKFNGVNVGVVGDITLNPANPQQVRLLLNIDADTPVNQSTRAILMTQGITGLMFVGLKASAVKAPPLQVKPGDMYPVILSDPSVLMELDTFLRKITEEVRNIGDSVHTLLSDENQKSIRQGLKNLDITLQNSQTGLQNFSQQALPSLIHTMTRFDNLLNSAEPFVKTLQDNPSALIRGKAPPVKGPGE